MKNLVNLFCEFINPKKTTIYNNGYETLSAFVSKYVWGIGDGKPLYNSNSGTGAYKTALREAFAMARDVNMAAQGFDFKEAVLDWLRDLANRTAFLDWCSDNGEGVNMEWLNE